MFKGNLTVFCEYFVVMSVIIFVMNIDALEFPGDYNMYAFVWYPNVTH